MWAANNDAILREIPAEHRISESAHIWEQECHSTLGLRWHPHSDTFSFTINPRESHTFTKRRILAETARLFDPLGWMAPVVIRAKIMIQSAWLSRLGWDTPLPASNAEQWAHYLSDLPRLADIRVQRWIGLDLVDAKHELHGFADASERGYAAVVYLRTTRKDQITIRLLTAKTKVAPIRQISLPRLELCAAALLAQLVTHVQSCLNLESIPVHLWSDSQVTLHWIRGHASRWKTYVANRVSHIPQRLPDAQWRHVPGKENPADCASRGIAPSELPNHPLWWTGPKWMLKDNNHWPAHHPELPDSEVPEHKVTATAHNTAVKFEPELLLRFSTLHRLLRVTSWCRRWRHKHDGYTLHAEELQHSKTAWIRIVQQVHYSNTITAVQKGHPLPKTNPLAPLNPYLDDSEVLRVGGRLGNSALPLDEKHPTILQQISWLTLLVIEACHKQTLHGGVQLTLGLIRTQFWIPRGRSTVKHVIHRCTMCIRWRAAAPQPMMGQLPRGRVTPTRPFLHTGLDYAGPIRIRSSKGRGHHASKAFISVFVCFSTKAVHIEAVSDYTADAFLAALRRFVSRRGLCSDLYSDCGTNFVGADRELRDLFRAASSDGRRIAHAAVTHAIKWHFNPPSAPHFGGLWEAAVKSTKHHLRRVIGDATLTFEEMSTLLTQIEACLNSRPIQPLSDDPADTASLTPGHFLIGAPLLAVPEPMTAEETRSTTARWKLVTQMRDHFWRRWMQEYIHSLNPRKKWTHDMPSPNVGDLCLIRNEVTPPCRWPLARIAHLHPGSDGITRVVTVRTAVSEFTRPLVKLVLFPRAESPECAKNTAT